MASPATLPDKSAGATGSSTQTGGPSKSRNKALGDTAARVREWRSALTILGALALIAGLVFAILAMRMHQVTTVHKTLTGTTVTYEQTDTGPGAPSTVLITGFLTAGVVLLIVAAFFNRITELDFAGITVKMAAAATAAASKADQLSKGSADKRSKILEKTAEIALR